ncbi:MAG: HlyD family type I secretion periplasmic adaptor subunit [Alphaproteobacteria bacterium]|nr:HlyD family type I secretion periplasmic adaptor subunit [Alphaproteobacteria bacterium]
MSLLRCDPLRPREGSSDRLIRLFQSETAEINEGPEPIQLRITLHVLAAFFASLIAIAAMMKMDRVVTSSAGVIVTTEPTIVLQALDPSIIKSINVQAGDRVKTGQLLATLDPTFAAADVRALTLQIASLDAQIARCEAEIAQRPFHPPVSTLPEAANYGVLQQAYYEQRKAQYNSQLAADSQQIAQIQATIGKLRNDTSRYADRAKIANDIEAMRAELAAAKYGSRLNLLEATDQHLEILRNVEFDKNSLAESEHQLDAAISNRDAFVQQWLSQVSQELLTARNTRDSAGEQLAKALKHRDLVQLEAPDEAVVLKLAKVSVGSVLKEGDSLIELAPLRSSVEAEVHIAARDIGFIRADDTATLKFDAFHFIEHGTAEGRVRAITNGSFTTDDNGNSIEPYYKARIEITSLHLTDLPKEFRLIPGMTLTGDIQVGTRSLFMYLVRGVVRGVGEAMREP